MAKYILDFEDTNFPYQAVIRTAADSTYIGQIPLSASLVAFSEGQASGTAQVTALPLGGAGPTTIQFDNYDWANCVPALSDFSTNAKIMAYLTTYFSGQAIVPTPTPNIMYYYTTPALDIGVRYGGSLFIPFSGGNGNPLDNISNNYVLGFAATLNQIYATVTAATLDETTLIELVQDKDTIADCTIDVGGVADAVLFNISANIIENKPLYYKITSASSSGEISFSIRAKVTPA